MAKSHLLFLVLVGFLTPTTAHGPATLINRAPMMRQSDVYAAGALINKTFFVNHNGLADFTSVQSAVDAIPDNNNVRIRIHVAAGVYREKVGIATNKTFILLEGEGRDQTSIEWDDYTNRNTPHGRNVPTELTATLNCGANNFVARSITFKNTFKIANNIRRAAAAQVYGDRAAFYNCGFISTQDTLSDLQGRHYYQNCYIEGAVDFIFGSAQSIFQGCQLWTSKLPAGMSPGFITAQGRDHAGATNGFVFRECTVDGVTPVYLGRAWRAYSRVIFYRTYMSNVIVRQGWYAWNYQGQERNLNMIESECMEPGSNRTGRAPWSRAASARQITRFIELSFISPDGWIEAQPH